MSQNGSHCRPNVSQILVGKTSAGPQFSQVGGHGIERVFRGQALFEALPHGAIQAFGLFVDPGPIGGLKLQWHSNPKSCNGRADWVYLRPQLARIGRLRYRLRPLALLPGILAATAVAEIEVNMSPPDSAEQLRHLAAIANYARKIWGGMIVFAGVSLWALAAGVMFATMPRPDTVTSFIFIGLFVAGLAMNIVGLCIVLTRHR